MFQTPVFAANGPMRAEEADSIDLNLVFADFFGSTDPFPGSPHSGAFGAEDARDVAQGSDVMPLLPKKIGIGRAMPMVSVTSTSLGKRSRVEAKDATDKQKLERRERNREHAKRSRIRKKFLLESLQDQVATLRNENMSLRRVVKEKIPDKASQILEQCTTEFSALLASKTGTGLTRELAEQDFKLVQALLSAQQCFAVSDPSLPDNPIVYVSSGFLELTGYKLEQVLGRNCRFLQGPGTDPRSVDVIRRGVHAGRDTSVCLLNYKADGTPFWNQFFIAALRDADGNIVNFVGVQCEVDTQAEVEGKKGRKRPVDLLASLPSQVVAHN